MRRLPEPPQGTASAQSRPNSGTPWRPTASNPQPSGQVHDLAEGDRRPLHPGAHRAHHEVVAPLDRFDRYVPDVPLPVTAQGTGTVVVRDEEITGEVDVPVEGTLPLGQDAQGLEEGHLRGEDRAKAQVPVYY